MAHCTARFECAHSRASVAGRVPVSGRCHFGRHWQFDIGHRQRTFQSRPDHIGRRYSDRDCPAQCHACRDFRVPIRRRIVANHPHARHGNWRQRRRQLASRIEGRRRRVPILWRVDARRWQHRKSAATRANPDRADAGQSVERWRW